MLSRLFLLAIAIIIARSQEGRDAGLTALVVVVVAFTVQLAVSAITRIGGKP
jgi:flavin reductase (DIM6/NTAB) family NADH-FMN oxidoreductase RutF